MDQTWVVLVSVVVSTFFVLFVGIVRDYCLDSSRLKPIVWSVILGLSAVLPVWFFFRSPSWAIGFVENMHLEQIVWLGLPLTAVHIGFFFMIISLSILIGYTGGTVHSIFAPLYIAFTAILNILLFGTGPTLFILIGVVFISAALFIQRGYSPDLKSGSIGPSWVRVASVRWSPTFSVALQHPSYSHLYEI